MRLGVTRQAVIKAVQSAEAQLGVPLLVKLQGRWRPTPEAFRLAELSEEVFDALLVSHHEAQMAAAGFSDRLRVCSAPNLAHSLLPGAVRMLNAAPGTPAHPVEIDISDVREALRARRSDVGLSFGLSDPGDDFETHPVAHGRLVCILAADDPLAAKTQIDPSDLIGRPLIGYDADNAPEQDTIRQAFTASGLMASITITVRHSDLACHLVRARCGPAVIDDFVVRGGLTAGLTARPLSVPTWVTAYVHHRRTESLSPAGQRFFAALRDDTAESASTEDG